MKQGQSRKKFHRRPKTSTLDVFSSDEEDQGLNVKAYGEQDLMDRRTNGQNAASTDFLLNDTVDLEDDEEIDDDEAFNESDDEKYGAFFNDQDSSGTEEYDMDDDENEDDNGHDDEDEADEVNMHVILTKDHF